MSDTEKVITTIDADVAFTRAWWLRACADPAMMEAWLKKLERTEMSGFYDWRLFQTKYHLVDKIQATAENIAQDEKKHSGILIGLMHERKIVPLTGNCHVSTYWEEMNQHIINFKTCAAVNYFGEALAAFRFEVILDMKETPEDIRNALEIILPDEQFHREALYRLAGPTSIAVIGPFHTAALANLKKT